jgi:hypothetical protein
MTNNPPPKLRTVIVSKRAFGFTVNQLKENGYRFDPVSKTWSGTTHLKYLIDSGYVYLVEPKDPPAESPTQ